MERCKRTDDDVLGGGGCAGRVSSAKTKEAWGRHQSRSNSGGHVPTLPCTHWPVAVNSPAPGHCARSNTPRLSVGIPCAILPISSFAPPLTCHSSCLPPGHWLQTHRALATSITRIMEEASDSLIYLRFFGWSCSQRSYDSLPDPHGSIDIKATTFSFCPASASSGEHHTCVISRLAELCHFH